MELCRQWSDGGAVRVSQVRVSQVRVSQVRHARAIGTVILLSTVCADSLLLSAE